MTCTLCPLGQGAITNCIGGRGTGSILVVGMQPGSHEDMEGRAFVGPSGEELAGMLRDAGYGKGEVRVTNAVRCAGGEVSTESIDACRTHLAAEIAQHKPAAIIALGDVALRSLLKVSGITARRGREFPLHKLFAYECEVFPTYRPAYVLRTPQARATVVADLRRARDRGKVEAPIAWTEWGRAIHAPRIAWDIETDFDYATKTGGENPTQVSFASAAGVEVERRDPLGAAAAEFLCNDGAEWGTWNGWQFDVPKLRAAGVDAPWGRDGMVLAYLMDENQSLGLESCAVKELGVRGWKESAHAPLGSDAFAAYNARDSVYTLRLIEHYLAELGPRVRIADEIIFPLKLALDACTKRGIYIDQVAVSIASAGFKWDAHQAKNQLEELVEGDFNPASPKQVLAALAARGYHMTSTDKKALEALRGEPFVDALQAWRHPTKMLSTYCKVYGAVERAHPAYSYIRTASGRTSSPIHTLPRALKKFFSAPAGKCFVVYDYAAIEFWVAAWCAGARSILDRKLTDPGWDPHRFLASHYYKKPERDVTPDERQYVKPANFELLYIGGGVQEAARQLYRLWHTLYPEFRVWYEATARELREFGYVESATGRRRHIGNTRNMRPSEWNAALREVVNHKVQSLATGDIAFLGLIAVHRAGYPVNYFGHDAVGFEFDSEREARANEEEITRLLTQEPIRVLADRFNVTFDVSLTVEATYRLGRATEQIK